VVSYRGGKLRPWFAAGGTRETARKLAEDGGKRMTELVEVKTPIDSGHLKESWKTIPVHVTAAATDHTVYESGVETDVEYAPYVEHGTGLWGPKHMKYPIRPKKPGGVLHFFVDGHEVFTTLVMHPGSPGAHMVAESAGVLEAGLAVAVEPELHLWAEKTEKQNHTGLGHP
jgi:hypothetical protein